MQRRTFLRRVLVGIGATVAALASAAALGVLGIWLNGWWAVGRRFKPVAHLGELTRGLPKLVIVFDKPANTWSFGKPKRLGQVWLIRRDGDRVEAYTARCPHQGGPIQLQGQQFVCLRHKAAFDLACHRLPVTKEGKPNPAPRDMDPLDVRTSADRATGDALIEVDYEDFVPGVAERKPAPKR